MKQIWENTLDVVKIHNGYALYGLRFCDSGPTFIAHMGDGVDSIVSDPDYDPNADPDLPEAYGFEVI